jgi:acyl-CoA reductase-like NAD-dependent aldehyde dehydrogenase
MRPKADVWRWSILTPRTSFTRTLHAFCRCAIAEEAGLPPGVLNVLSGVGHELGLVRKVYVFVGHGECWGRCAE